MIASVVRLGVNIDHVATVRNARGGVHPDPILAAQLAIEAGADGITAHLREDRRHIRDSDMARLMAGLNAPLNFEMAATAEMVEIASRLRPHACCLVPERREEVTTEGGLNAHAQHNTLAPLIDRLRDCGIRVSLFIDPDPAQIDAAVRLRAPVVELHTGRYCDKIAEGDRDVAEAELRRLAFAASLAHEQGLEVHAGHGLNFDTAADLAAVPQVRELNIGHFLVGEAIFLSLSEAIGRMKQSIEQGVARRPRSA